MSDRTDQAFLLDIWEAIRRIRAYVTGLDFDSFAQDVKTQDAVIRNLEVLGEATKNLSDELRATHSCVPWKSMAAARDRLIHHYFGINLDIVWQIVSVEVPKLLEHLPVAEDDDAGS